MSSMWKSKVLPGINKIFDKDGKKAAAYDFNKSFNKEEISKEIEEKKTELEPKVLEVYEAAPAEIKTIIKEKKAAKIKKCSASVTAFIEELSKIEFPGAKPVSEAMTKSGPILVSGPILFIFEKVVTFIPEPVATKETAPVAEEEKKEEGEAAEKEEEKKEEEEKEEEKKEEEKVVEEPTSSEPPK